MKQLMLPFVLCALACSGSGQVAKDVAKECAPSPDQLLSDVNMMLDAPDYQTALKQFALSRGTDTVACALASIVNRLSQPGAPASSGPRLARAEEMLKELR